MGYGGRYRDFAAGLGIKLRIIKRYPDSVNVDGGQNAGGRRGEVGDREANTVAGGELVRRIMWH